MDRDSFNKTVIELSKYHLSAGEVRVLTFFLDGPETTLTLEKGLGIHRTTVFEYLRRLQMKGLLAHNKEWRDGAKLYEIPDSVFNIF